MSDSAGQIGLDLVVNSNSFHKQMGSVQKLANKTGKALAAAFTVKTIANFGKQCLELGSDLQEVQNVVDVTFGNMSSKINKFAQEAAKTSGLSETMAKKYAGTFGAMAKSFKLDPKEVYDMSTALTTLTGDVASFYNLSQDEAYTKLKSVFTGETESLKDLGVVMTQTALDQYALANGFDKTTAAMSEAEKVSLRYAFVTDQLKGAAGDFIRTQDSWANQTRILSLQMESFKAAIGQGLINILTPVIKWINLLMEKLVAAANAFKRFTEAITGENAEEPQVQNTTAGLETVANSADTATNSIEQTKKAATKLKRELAGFDQITKLGGGSEESAEPNTTPAASTPLSATPKSATVEDAGKKIDVKKYKTLSKALDNLKQSFGGFTKAVKSAGTWTYTNILQPLGKWTMNKLAPKVLNLLAAAFDVLTEVGKAVAPVFQGLWDKFLKPIAKFTGKAIITFLDGFTTALKKLAAWIPKHQGLVQGLVTVLLSLLAIKKVTFVINTLIAAFRNGKKIGGFAKGLSQIAGVTGKFGKTSNFVSKLSGAFGKLKGVFGKVKVVIGKVLPVLIKLGKFLLTKSPIVLGITAAVAAGVLLYKNWDKIKKAATKLKKKIVTEFKAIINNIKEMPKKIKEWFSGKIEGVTEWFGGIKESFLNTLTNLTEDLPDLSEIATTISEGIGEVKAKVTAWFADRKEDISNAWNDLTADVKEKTAELKAEIKQKWTDLKTKWEDITSNVKEKSAELKAEIKQKWEDLKASWESITGNIKEKTADMKAQIASKWTDLQGNWSSIISNIKDKTASMKAKVSTAKEALKEKWSALTSIIKGKTASMKAKVSTTKDSLKKKWDTLTDTIKDKTVTITAKLKDNITEAIKTMWNGVATGINNAIGTINKIPGVDIKKLPMLAQGGYVKKNTPQLAMIGDNRHQGEVVAPENKLLEMARMAAAGSGGRDAEIVALLKQIATLISALDLEAKIDGNSMMNLIVKLINQKTRSTGHCPISF